MKKKVFDGVVEGSDWKKALMAALAEKDTP
jgi:hypothetical protein